MTEHRYTVSLHRTIEGFSVWAPGLPGCACQGETEAEALDNIRAAIDEYLSVANEISGSPEKRAVVLMRALDSKTRSSQRQHSRGHRTGSRPTSDEFRRLL